MTNEGDRGGAVKPGAGQAPSAGKTRYERSLSPPRSSSSSGYGTGSSSKSFMECNGNTVTQLPGPSQGPVRVNGTSNGQSEDRFREAVIQSEAGTLTSTSSGQSCDERWYDFMDQPPSSSDNSPPPLPTRIGSKGPGSAFQTVSSTPVSSGRRSTNERQRRAATDQSESSVKSSPDTAPAASPYQVPVTKYSSSVSGPRAYNGYESASSSDTVKSSSTVQTVHITGPSLETERRSVEARSTYLTDYELNNNRSSVETEIAKSETQSPTAQQQQQLNNESYLVHNRLAALKTSPVQQQQQHATYSNVIEAEREERLVSVQSSASVASAASGARSEDELSQLSGHSPVRPRSGGRRHTTGATTPSSTTSASSRGHSPRLGTEARSEERGGHQVSGVKKKVARSARNSANLAGSSLQEDLMRLISPEYNQEAPKEAKDAVKEQGGRSQGPGPSVQDSPLSKLPKKTLSELSLMKSRSRENIARLEVSETFLLSN